ncbi:hypothetical protein [Mesorhizobium sp. L-2-11]|uniref:hypothetical protein n=1 Tax=Mesorhizobium sp. L-2-11 TaxID=2744521 RepID=UPI001925507E|nr:hypothetical protein [Mesorhizobium sp. L-2-11]BCH19591.1 hypothetical protein MesoLjLa_64420 [Mesorhizobium sp. L-2-11]
MHRQFAELRDRFLGRKYQTERGHEFAYHGFSRRLGTMVRAVDVVFEKLPPELDEIPERDTVFDATLTIQAFVMSSGVSIIWPGHADFLASDPVMYFQSPFASRERCHHLSDQLAANFPCA